MAYFWQSTAEKNCNYQNIVAAIKLYLNTALYNHQTIHVTRGTSYIIIIVDEQAVYIPAVKQSSTKKILRKKKKQINIVTSVHYQQFAKVFGN